MKTYVDDIFPLVVAKEDENINAKVKETITAISDYMNSNKLALNIPKTQVLVVTKKKETK